MTNAAAWSWIDSITYDGRDDNCGRKTENKNNNEIIKIAGVNHMKITLKSTHYNIEICPEEVPDTVLEPLIESICGGWPLGNDTVVQLIRSVHSAAEGSADKQKE